MKEEADNGFGELRADHLRNEQEVVVVDKDCKERKQMVNDIVEENAGTGETD